MAKTAQRRRRDRKSSSERVGPKRGLMPVICVQCGGELVMGQQSVPTLTMHVARGLDHPVLSKPITLKGVVSVDGTSRHDLTVHDQLRQRAAMGGEAELAALKAFEAMWVEVL